MAICLFSEARMWTLCNKATAKRDHLSGPSPRSGIAVPRCQKRHRRPDMENANCKSKQLAAPALPLASELKPHPEGSEIMQSFMHFQMWSLARSLRCSYQGSTTLNIKEVFKVLLCQRHLFLLGFISFTISCWAWKSSQCLKRLKFTPGMSHYF